MLKKYEKYGVISFDLYETLVNRLVAAPNCVFKILEKRFCEIYGREIDDFIEKRIKAERELYTQREYNINLEKIYANIEGISETDKCVCRRLEEEIEYDLAYPNEKGLSLYKYFLALKKKIVIISDMYLSQELLIRILHKCGVDSVFRIYISGYEGCSKHPYGNLYRKVCQDLKISPSEILHIGDNIKSDVFNAKLNQVQSIYIRTDRTPYIEKFAKNTLNICKNRDEKIGYYYFGALTLAYITWIHSKCKEQNINMLYFFSREGWILKKVFDDIYENEIKTKYLYVSRKSLSVPRLQTCENFEDVKKVMYIDSPTMTVGRFLNKLGIDVKTVKGDLEKNNIRLDAELRGIENKEHFYELLWPTLKEESERQAKYAKKYLLNEIDNCESIAGIVDIGWTGTMQNNFINMLRFCGIKQEIRGFFLGQRKEIGKYLENGMENTSFLFDYKDSMNRNIITSGCNFLEFVYSAPHGTTLGYNEKGAILAPNELSVSMANHLLAIQDGIILYVKQARTLQEKYGILTKKQILQQLAHLFKNPPLQLLDYIGEWEFFDDRQIRLAHRIEKFSIKQFYKEAVAAGWNVGFIKRNIRIPFPYYGVFNILRKVKDQINGNV